MMGYAGIMRTPASLDRNGNSDNCSWTGEAESEAQAKQNPKQRISARLGKTIQNAIATNAQTLVAEVVLQNRANAVGAEASVAKFAEMGGTRLELVTSTMSTWRSNQLS